MLRSRLFWQVAGTQLALVIVTAALPRLLGPTLGTLVVLAALVGAFFLAARLGRRANQLAETVQAVVAGQAVPSIATDPADAFVELSRVLDELIRRCNEGRAQLDREQQAARQAREAADTASSARSDFLAILSHEIRTPLNGVMGMTQLALQTRLDAEQREYLEVVQSSADFLLAIINDLRDFARREAGGLRWQSVRFPLRHTLGETVKLLGLRAQQKGLELLLRIRPDVPDVLEGDPDRLRQLLVNLLTNAIAFTERGEVVLSVERALDRGSKTEIALAASLARIPLHFQVSDTGIGIPAEKLAAMMHTLPGSPAATAEAGLGLTIARQLAEGMGGSLWAESVGGEGSTFRFTAQFQVPRDGASEAQTGSPQLPGLHVLIVDDNSTSRDILGEVLASWRMEATKAANADDALAALERARATASPFALAIIDAHMPEIDGFTLVERIRQQPDLAALPILMLIAGHQPEDAARCRQMQIAAHGMKPLPPGELLRAVRKALNLSESVPGPAPVPAGPPPLRVLVAEGNSANRQLAVVVLEKLGHRVQHAATGRTALALLEQGDIDLLLVDPQLPDPPGLEIVAGIREREKASGGHLPIIALIPYGQTEDRERCRLVGIDCYVAKPLQMKELVRAIETVRMSAGG